MALTKAQKNTILDELKEKIDKQKSIAFCDFTGLKVKDLSELRKIMREQNCELKVAKKTLMSLALKEKNISADLDKLQGEVALGFGYNDEVSPFKTIYNFAKGKENLKMLGGLIAGQFYGKDQAVELAKLPSREELVAKLLFVPNVPISSIFNILQGSLNILKVKG